jgi:hypothetical protein
MTKGQRSKADTNGVNSTQRWLKRRGPYQSLAIVATPLAVVEPAKLVALAIVGKGHWLWGLAIMVTAYSTSIFFLHRLFAIVKPKLLKLAWFARLWCWFTRLRSKVTAPFVK